MFTLKNFISWIKSRQISFGWYISRVTLFLFRSWAICIELSNSIYLQVFLFYFKQYWFFSMLYTIDQPSLELSYVYPYFKINFTWTTVLLLNSVNLKHTVLPIVGDLCGMILQKIKVRRREIQNKENTHINQNSHFILT